MGADTLMVGGWSTAKCFEADVLLYSGGMDRDEVCSRQSRQVRRSCGDASASGLELCDQAYITIAKHLSHFRKDHHMVSGRRVAESDISSQDSCLVVEHAGETTLEIKSTPSYYTAETRRIDVFTRVILLRSLDSVRD
jgi:hypothetical protein